MNAKHQYAFEKLMSVLLGLCNLAIDGEISLASHQLYFFTTVTLMALLA